MNKLVIPTILAFSVLIAGISAFMPVDKATTVDDAIIAALNGTIANSYDEVLLDLEDKIKLSSASDGTSFTSGEDDGTSTVTIQALDDGQPTTFNLKECYLQGESTTNNTSDEVEVVAIFIDGIQLYQGSDRQFSRFGPIDTSNTINTATVEIISGLGFHTGLGADDTITITVIVDFDDRVKDITCIAFVQNSADLVVTVTEPPFD